MKSKRFSRLAKIVISAVLVTCGAAFTSKGLQTENGKTSFLAPGKHFERVLIVVLENQNYSSAMSNEFLAKLATKGTSFTNFKNLYHPSYARLRDGVVENMHHLWTALLGTIALAWMITAIRAWRGMSGLPKLREVTPLRDKECPGVSILIAARNEAARGDPGLAVSPDKKTILYTQLDALNTEIILVENFR